MRKLYFGLVILVLYGCGSGKKPNEKAFLESLDTMQMEGPAISEEVIGDIIQQIPSPLEISMMLKESGANYDNEILNSPDNISQYNSNYHKALNLGIYGADLGYTNIYGQNQDALFYLNAIKELADGLSIGQFFEFGTIKRLATNSSNLDSLLLITTKNFNNINSYLQEQHRSNLSILILTGGWLEALHITCEIAKRNPNDEALKEKIGEQKIILDNIKLLLEFYKNSDFNIEQLYKKVLKLEEVYSNVKIVRTYAEPTFVEKDGMLVIQDNSSTNINITNENLKAIRQTIDNIRDSIIN